MSDLPETDLLKSAENGAVPACRALVTLLGENEDFINTVRDYKKVKTRTCLISLILDGLIENLSRHLFLKKLPEAALEAFSSANPQQLH
jgi:hypothetical protein